jgi:superfamily II DNA/RNA helicase
MSTMTVSSPQDFEAVIPFLTREPGVANTRSNLVKTCIFVNEVQLAMKLTRFLRERMPNVSDAIASMYALREDNTKRRVMAEFKGGGADGGIIILVATEAAGMVSSLRPPPQQDRI